MLDNEGRKILWDFPIQTDKAIEHRRPDIVCINKIPKSCLIVDIGRRPEHHCEKTKQEKIDKYQDLRIELGKIWRLKAEVGLVVLGALGT